MGILRHLWCRAIKDRDLNSIDTANSHCFILLSASKTQQSRVRKAQKAKPPPLAWFLVLDLLGNKKQGANCRNFLDSSRSSWVQTQIKDTGLKESCSCKGFFQQYQGVQSKVSGRANIPYPRFPQPDTLAWGNSSTKYWGTEELYWFGRSLKVTPSHVCLPCRHTERETERPPGGPAIKHHRQDYFGGIFLISCTAALTFVSLPFPFLLFSCFNTLHTQPLPPFLLCFSSPGFTFKWSCILSHPDGTEARKQWSFWTFPF